MSISIKNRLIRLAILLFLLWIIASFSLFLFANKIIFKTSYSQGAVKSNSQYEEIYLKYNKKQKIYIIQSLDKESDTVVLFLHGNAGQIGRIIDDQSLKYNVVIPAYPGYHLSDGKPSEDALYKTLDITIQYVRSLGFKDQDIIVFGISLGGVPAIYAAKKYPNLNKVIIVGAFDSIKSMCLDIYSIFCTFSGFMFDNVKLAQNTKVKIRQFHSIEDEIVHFNKGKRLFKYFSSKDKKFYPITGSHNDFSIGDLIRLSNTSD